MQSAGGLISIIGVQSYYPIHAARMRVDFLEKRVGFVLVIFETGKG